MAASLKKADIYKDMTMRHTKDTKKVLVENTAVEATALAAEIFKTTICEAVDARGECALALAGGTTPHALYQQLAETAASGEVPWESVEVYFGDERDVPHDNVESNYLMIQRNLLDHVPVQPGKVHPMPADAEDLATAADQYEKMIRANVVSGTDGLPQFDLVLLGMGGDGHTASLFAGTDAVDQTDKLVKACFVPVLGRSRMTLTFPLINAARNVLLLVTGADKAEAVAKLLSEDPAARQDLPAGHIDPKGNFIVVLDAPAARVTRPRTELD